MLNLTASLPEQTRDLAPQITVVGVGGAGCNAVNNMIASKLEGVRFISCNTDAQALKHSLAPTRIQLGPHITAGLGAGSKPEVGRAAAEESIDAVMAEIEGANMVFITGGMGGGTATGAAPVIARAAKEAGILTVGVVTKPFHFEGAHRMRLAEAGLAQMQEYVDTLIVIPNQNLFRVANEKTTFADAFRMADSVLQSGVRGVTDLMVMPGLINLDFADVRCAMMEMGKAMMGTGEALGERRAVEAAELAINNPLLDDISMKGARGVIINITGGYDMTLFEVDEACNRIRDEVDADANIIFGSTFDENLEGVMRVTVLATGIESEAIRRARPVRPANTAAQSTSSVAAPAVPASALVASGFVGEGLYGSASGIQQQLVVPSASARVSAPSVMEPTTVRRVEATAPPSQTIYHQPELGVGVGQPVAGGSAAELSRGVRYGGAFIPPRPVDPEGGRAFAAPVAASAAVQVAQPEEDNAFMPEIPARPAGLQLNPPVPGAKKRAPSLFDKIAGMFSEHDEAEAEIAPLSGNSSDAGSASGSSGGGLFAGFSMTRRGGGASAAASAVAQPQTQPIQQPQVAAPEPYIQRQPAAPAAATQIQPQVAGPDLEIPAFLRRQIS